jgi:hypothetical protein
MRTNARVLEFASKAAAYRFYSRANTKKLDYGYIYEEKRPLFTSGSKFDNAE